MRKLFCLIATYVIALGWTGVACGMAPPSRSFLVRPVIIPIEVIGSGHIGIHAMINGHGPYRFIFDTGAPALVISEQVAKDSRILPVDFSRPFFAPLGNLGNYDVKTISLGRATQSNLEANVWNHPTVELIGREFGRFEGLIGFPFFAHYQITIDYKSKTMKLVPSAFVPADTQEKMANRLMGSTPATTWAPAESLGIRVTKPAADDAAGVQLSAVMTSSPADEAGLKTGDRLLTLDGHWTDSIDDCYAALSGVDHARDVPADVLRDGKRIRVLLKVKPAI